MDVDLDLDMHVHVTARSLVASQFQKPQHTTHTYPRLSVMLPGTAAPIPHSNPRRVSTEFALRRPSARVKKKAKPQVSIESF